MTDERKSESVQQVLERTIEKAQQWVQSEEGRKALLDATRAADATVEELNAGSRVKSAVLKARFAGG